MKAPFHWTQEGLERISVCYRLRAKLSAELPRHQLSSGEGMKGGAATRTVQDLMCEFTDAHRVSVNEPIKKAKHESPTVAGCNTNGGSGGSKGTTPGQKVDDVAAPDQLLNITLRPICGDEEVNPVVSCQIDRNEKLGGIVEWYISAVKNEDLYRTMVFDGNRLSRDSTPADYDMEDGDVIELFMQQIGD